MDIITDLRKVNGYDQIWVIVDRFTKMAHFIPLKNRRAHTLAIAFIREIWRLHGLPIGVVSDRDTVFTLKLWSKVMRLLVIFSKTKEEDIASLKTVCNKLRQHKVFGNRSKTMMLPDALSILGHTITSQGLFAEPQKILKVNNWSTPTKRKELQGFMGMVNYLSTYVPYLATVATPLTRLCRDTVKFQMGTNISR